MNKLSIITLVVLALAAFACSPKAALSPEAKTVEKIETPAVKAGWEQEWDVLTREAKKEQWLVIYSNSGGETRQALTRAVKDRFGINVDWLTAMPPALLAKVLAEHRAGITAVDIIISGSTAGYALKPYNIVEPLDKYLLLPEVINPANWNENKFPWWDSEHMIIISLLNISPTIGVNTDLVGDKEITSYWDLLNPKWKEKISMTSPLIGGTGLASFGMLGEYVLGWDYFKELAKQEPVIFTDTRLAVDWLSRGKQAIAFAARSESMIEFQKAGAPIKYISMKEGSYATDAGTGFVKLKDAPHKAASTIFINWLLTREGQKTFSEARGFASNRVDVPKDRIDPIRVRVPGVKYYAQDEKARALEDTWILKSKEILGPLMK